MPVRGVRQTPFYLRIIRQKEKPLAVGIQSPHRIDVPGKGTKGLERQPDPLRGESGHNAIRFVEEYAGLLGRSFHVKNILRVFFPIKEVVLFVPEVLRVSRDIAGHVWNYYFTEYGDCASSTRTGLTMPINRRTFLQNAATLGTGAALSQVLSQASTAAHPLQVPQPVVVSSANGLRAVTRAMELIRGGSDALEAVVAGVNIVEDDPNDTSVGYGGLPNEEGVVELDAAVMHGPTHRAGAVASLRNIKNPSRVALTVMERTDHVLLVGDGALRFARAHGFKEEDLLTDKARLAWLNWKENLSNRDDWLPPHTMDDRDIGENVDPLLRNSFGAFFRHTGTIHCGGLDLHGNLSCVTTTSGLAFKIPGRVGDSPIVGAGLYADNAVGSAGSTGRGEANLANCSCRMIVERMSAGKSPEQACLDVVQSIVDHTRMRRLQDDNGRPRFEVEFYALNARGEYGGARIYSGGKFSVHNGTEARHVPLAYLYKK